MNQPNIRQRNSGFTLVELLVVIGVIALLISMLLPALNKAREQAARTACLANLRTMGQFINMYANQFKGAVPTGVDRAIQTNHALQRALDPDTGPYTLGLLVPTFKITDGRFFYCPTAGQEKHQYDTPSNPWFYPNPHRKNVLMAYSQRPALKMGADVTTPYDGVATTWGDTNAFNEYPWIWPGAASDVGRFRFDQPLPPSATKPPRPMPKITQIKSIAIVTDLVATNDAVKQTHRSGVNALYGDGSARYYVKSKQFDKYLSYLGSDVTNNSGSTSAKYTLALRGMWDLLDRGN